MAGAENGFDVNRSQVADTTLAFFLASPVSEDLSTVPGIGPAAIANLANATESDPAITSTHQLLGKFLMLKGAGVSEKEHCDKMWNWLRDRRINAFRSGIVHSLAMKTNIMIPGLYSCVGSENEA